jgi:hypothetical protein
MGNRDCMPVPATRAALARLSEADLQALMDEVLFEMMRRTGAYGALESYEASGTPN